MTNPFRRILQRILHPLKMMPLADATGDEDEDPPQNNDEDDDLDGNPVYSLNDPPEEPPDDNTEEPLEEPTQGPSDDANSNPSEEPLPENPPEEPPEEPPSENPPENPPEEPPEEEPPEIPPNEYQESTGIVDDPYPFVLTNGGTRMSLDIFGRWGGDEFDLQMDGTQGEFPIGKWQSIRNDNEYLIFDGQYMERHMERHSDGFGAPFKYTCQIVDDTMIFRYVGRL
jgi:hypothetical protein